MTAARGIDSNINNSPARAQQPNARVTWTGMRTLGDFTSKLTWLCMASLLKNMKFLKNVHLTSLGLYSPSMEFLVAQV